MDARTGALLHLPSLAAPPVGWQDRRAFAYPVLVCLALLLVLRGPFGPTGLHDSLAIYWVWADQFTAALAHGNLYPRWLPASDAGLGTPVFYFYPPLAFHLAGAFDLAGLSTFASLIAVFACGFAGSGIACWHWLKGRTNHPLLGAVFFVAAPYHVFNYVDRGAVAESLATALIPVIAIALRRVADNRGGVTLLALAYAALIGTHLPLALLVSLFMIGPYALAHRERLIRFAAAIAAGIAMAAIYLLPAFAFRNAHDLDQLYRAPNLRTEYYSFLAGHWSDPTYAIVFSIVLCIAAASLLPAIRRDGWARYALVIVGVVAGLVPMLWSLPILKDVQFPYRALPIAEFALAAAIARLPRDPGVALGPALLPLCLSVAILPGLYPDPGDLKRLQSVHPDVYEYMPKGVLAPGQTTARLSDVLAPRSPPPHVSGMIVERHFYFPAWSCGAMEPRTQLLMHNPGCTPRIVWTLPEWIGAAISAITLLLVATLALIRRRPLSTS